MKPWIRLLLLCLAVAGLFAWLLSVMPLRSPTTVSTPKNYQPWDPEIVKAAESIPLQDGGRIKPLLSFGRFHLMGLSSKSKLSYEHQGEIKKLSSTEWILDCLFRPRQAASFRVFSIDDSELLESIGITPELTTGRKRRDLYSYEELQVGHEKLMQKAISAQQTLDNDKTLEPDEKAKLKQVVELQKKIQSFERVAGTFAFADRPVFLSGIIFGKEAANGREVSFVSALEFGYSFIGAAENAKRENKAIDPAVTSVANELLAVEFFTKQGLSLLAPLQKNDADWASYGQLIASLNKGEGRIDHEKFNATGEGFMRDLREIEELQAALKSGDQDLFKSLFLTWANTRKEEAKQIPDAAKVASERWYYKVGYLHSGLGFFICGFLFIALSWLVPQSKFGKVTSVMSLVFMILATLFVSAAVIHRCYIMERPPVGNLYDTIPFIVATGAMLAIVAEFLTKRRGIALPIGLVFGTGLSFLAIRFEAGTGQDTMDPLVAVLRSSMWLSTHVITVVLGYMAALLAAAISHVYLLGKVFKLDGGDRGIQRDLTRMTYGVIAFALVFSTIGTLLGGVWANDSWGRFWGWDPKENGALMIVLMNLIILHARVGGMIRDVGLHVLSVVGGIVVAFSWWGVNMLEVGLHSYGFTSGAEVLNYFYAIEIGFVVLVLMAHWLQQNPKRSAKTADDPSKADASNPSA